jgi:ferrous iron transport protein B
MPIYQWPQWLSLWRHSWHRLSRFIVNAGKLIVPVCVVLSILNGVTLEGKLIDHNTQQPSILSTVGKSMVGVFEPIGIDEDNWPAAVGLLTGIMAKEVVIGTLNSLYSQTGQASSSHMEEAAYGEMMTRFHGKANAFAYLLFVLLYFPCISATAAMLKEVQKGWTVFSICWTTGLAYAMALVFYQSATFWAHPRQSLLWFGLTAFIGGITLWGIRYYSKTYLYHHVPTRIVLT